MKQILLVLLNSVDYPNHPHKKYPALASPDFGLSSKLVKLSAVEFPIPEVLNRCMKYPIGISFNPTTFVRLISFHAT